MESLWAISARSIQQRLVLCLLPAAGCLLATGCNNGKQLQTDLYQRELRLQEDEIYRLEDYLEEYQAIVQNYRCELAEVRRELAERQRSDEPIDAEREPTAMESLPTPSGSDPILEEPIVEDPIEIGATPDMPTDAPTGEAIDAPAEAPAYDEPAPLFNGGASERTPTSEHRLTTLEEGDEPKLQVTPASAPPTPYPHAVATTRPQTVGLDSRLTLSARNLPGAESTVVVTLAEAEPAALAGFEGEASVMLTQTDPAGGMQRLARWDFTPGEVLHAWRTNPDRHGTAIELPITLPHEAPSEERLRLWVRLVDREGKKRMQATPVWLAGRPLRIDASRKALTLGPLRRLPTTESDSPQPAEFLLVDDARPISEWRAAADGPSRRRTDPALQTASFDETRSK